MPYAIGVVLALSTVAFARLVGFDRDRAFYPIVLVIIASYYVLFAVMGGSTKPRRISRCKGSGSRSCTHVHQRLKT